MRKRDPLRYWKFSENDHKILKKWDKLSPYIERILNETNHHIPWQKINSDDKLNGILETVQIVLKEFNYDYKNYELFKQTEFVIFLDLHGVLITKLYNLFVLFIENNLMILDTFNLTDIKHDKLPKINHLNVSTFSIFNCDFTSIDVNEIPVFKVKIPPIPLVTVMLGLAKSPVL